MRQMGRSLFYVPPFVGVSTLTHPAHGTSTNRDQLLTSCLYNPPKLSSPANSLHARVSAWNLSTKSTINSMADNIDYSFVNELYEEIERRPPGIEARKLLIETYIAAELTDAVGDAVRELKTLCTNDRQVNEWHTVFCSTSPQGTGSSGSSSVPSASSKEQPKSAL